MRWRRFALTALVAAALAACGSNVTNGHGSAAIATSTPSHHDFPSTRTSPTQSAPPSSQASTPAQVGSPQQRLQAQVGAGQRVLLVRLPAGFEAVSYDQRGHLTFWSLASGAATWGRIGQSSYPVSAALGAPHATVVGALLRGMQHATFIVHGIFTGDGSGNAVAFTTGPHGWGAVKAEPNGNIGPSGHPVGSNKIGLSYDFAFAAGELVTKDCPMNRPISECSAHAITKHWVWTGTDFRRA